MSAKIIDGKGFAHALGEKLAQKGRAFHTQVGRLPALAVVLVGADPASEVYVRAKGRMAQTLGFRSLEYVLPADVSQSALLALIDQLNTDTEVDGILVQLPLPEGLDQRAVISAIDPAKDVDGLHPLNAGYLASGLEGMFSCTPLGCMMLIKDQIRDLRGLNALVVGRSILVGKPMAQLLLAADCTVTVAHRYTPDLQAEVARADILVAACGQPRLIKGEWIKPGAVVIDVGTTRMVIDGKTRLVGDVDFDSARARAAALTPVPGGVGPMTIMSLMHNTLVAAFRRAGLNAPDFG